MNRALLPPASAVRSGDLYLRLLRPLLKGDPPGPSRHSGRLSGGVMHKAGDPVRQTGIYEVTHDREHRAAHDVVMLAGDAFPPCETCDHRVRFRLVRTAPYIFQDEDFENPEE